MTANAQDSTAAAAKVFAQILGRSPKHGADDLLLRRLGRHLDRLREAHTSARSKAA